MVNMEEINAVNKINEYRVNKINEYIVNKSLGIPYTKDNTSKEIPIVSNEYDDVRLNQDKNIIVKNLYFDILNIIQNDSFEDGEISQSEQYMDECYNDVNASYIKEALMNIYLDWFSDIHAEHILTGILTMLGVRTYEEMQPHGQTMVLGLLQHRDIYLRDKAIQTFERWNSKKGIPVLEGLRCDQKWLQNYVDKVIMYLKRDGVD